MSQAISNAHMEEDDREGKEVPVTVRPVAAAASAAGVGVGVGVGAGAESSSSESDAEEVEVNEEIEEKSEALEAKVVSEVEEEIALILADDTKYLEEEKTLNDTGKCLINGKYMYLTWKHWIQKERILARLQKHGFQVLEMNVGHDIGDPVNNYHHTHALIYVEWVAQHGGATKQVVTILWDLWISCLHGSIVKWSWMKKANTRHHIRIFANELVTPI